MRQASVHKAITIAPPKQSHYRFMHRALVHAVVMTFMHQPSVHEITMILLPIPNIDMCWRRTYVHKTITILLQQQKSWSIHAPSLGAYNYHEFAAIAKSWYI